MGLEACPEDGNLRPFNSQKNDDSTSQQNLPCRQSRRASFCVRCCNLSIWFLTHGLCPLITLVMIIRYVIVMNQIDREFVRIQQGPKELDRGHHSSRFTATAPTYHQMETPKHRGPFGSLRGPHITANFPDPCVVFHDGITYAFATNNRKAGAEHVNVQIAISGDNKTWELKSDLDAFPRIAPWQTGSAVWAPDVKHLPNDHFLLYYTDSLITDPETHCIGAAVSDAITGPYVPYSEPLICPYGGAIDPAGFLDRSTGQRYIVYKVDGNSLGHGGLCRNDVPPIMSTPLMLQEVDPNNGVTLIGSPSQLLDRDALDGPLIEAPAMYLSTEGIYFLFFSSHCFTTPLYHTAYATSTNATGPYTRAERPLLITGDGDEYDLGIVGPGGLDIIHHAYAMSTEGAPHVSLEGLSHETSHIHNEEGRLVVFHGIMTPHNMPDNDQRQWPIQDLHLPFVRGMYSGILHFRGTLATFRRGGFKSTEDDDAVQDDNELESSTSTGGTEDSGANPTATGRTSTEISLSAGASLRRLYLDSWTVVLFLLVSRWYFL